MYSDFQIDKYIWQISYSKWSEKSALSPFLFNFAFDYTFKKVQANQ
jgi:hypothetical protein